MRDRRRMRRFGLAALLAMGVLVSTSRARADAATWPEISAPVSVEKIGANDAAVLVGIEDYIFVADIPGATRNLKDWTTYLSDSRGVPLEHVHVLMNAQGTREGILAATKTAAQEVKPGGTLWFVYIGHGAPAQDGKDGVLVGADAQQSADSLYARSVKQGEVMDVLKSAPSGVTPIMIVDACFSGRTGTGTPLVTDLQPLISLNLLSTAGVTVMSAGGPDQFAGSLPNSGRPAFSYLVLGALRGWAADAQGTVTAQSAVNYANRVLHTVPIGRAQEPRLSGPEMGMVLSRGAREAAPELKKFVVQQEPQRAVQPENGVPPDAVRVNFKSPDPDQHWTLRKRGNKNVVCELPCTQWVTDSDKYYLQLDAANARRVRQIDVPAVGYSPGRNVEAVPYLENGATFIVGILGISVGSAGLLYSAIGAGLTPNDSDWHTVSIVGASISGVAVVAGIVGLACYHPYGVDFTLAKNRTASRRTNELRLASPERPQRASGFAINPILSPTYVGLSGSF